MQVGEGQRDRETESEAGSRLWAVNPEPDAGLEPTKRTVRSWPESKSDAQPIEPHRRPSEIWIFNTPKKTEGDFCLFCFVAALFLRFLPFFFQSAVISYALDVTVQYCEISNLMLHITTSWLSFQIFHKSLCMPDWLLRSRKFNIIYNHGSDIFSSVKYYH